MLTTSAGQVAKAVLGLLGASTVSFKAWRQPRSLPYGMPVPPAEITG